VCACQVAWLDELLIEMKLKHHVGMKFFIYTKFKINFSKNIVIHGKRNYVDTKFYYLRDIANEGKLEVIIYFNTLDQVVIFSPNQIGAKDLNFLC